MDEKNPTNDFYLFPSVQSNVEVHNELRSLARFRRALRKEDQEVIDNLITSIQPHLPLAHLAERLTPIEYVLLSMLLEQKKEIGRLTSEIVTVKDSWVHPPFP